MVTITIVGVASVRGVDELGTCAGCGYCLVARVLSFARCAGCGAENYRPLPNAEPLEVKVARFWARCTLGPLSTEGSANSRRLPVEPARDSSGCVDRVRRVRRARGQKSQVLSGALV